MIVGLSKTGKTTMASSGFLLLWAKQSGPELYQESLKSVIC
jgi:hypothetical protein